MCGATGDEPVACDGERGCDFALERLSGGHPEDPFGVFWPSDEYADVPGACGRINGTK